VIVGNISHNKLERAFLEYMEKYADLDVSEEIKIEQQKRQENQAQIEAYREKLRQLELREREAMKLYVVDGEMDFDGYREIKNMVNREKSAISAEVERLQLAENEVPVNKADIIKNFLENWELLSASERRQLLVENMGKIRAGNHHFKWWYGGTPPTRGLNRPLTFV
jgi:hypothetical protein